MAGEKANAWRDLIGRQLAIVRGRAPPRPPIFVGKIDLLNASFPLSDDDSWVREEITRF